jgi:hypothetical protein
MGCAEFVDDPTALNSNLLPVNAKGDVLFLSVLSLNISGILSILIDFFSLVSSAVESFKNAFNTCVNFDPMNAEIIAGGASLAPSLWSFDAEAILALMISELSCSAFIVLMKIVRKSKLELGSDPGDNRLTPVFVINDQLLCFPDPFIPAKGFSCNSTLK